MKRWLGLLFLGGFLAGATGAAAQDPHATVSSTLNVSAVRSGQDAVIAVVLNIKPGFHSQSHTPKGEGNIALDVAMAKNPAATARPIVYPAGRLENYPKGIGEVSIYTGKVVVYVPLMISPDVNEGPLKLDGTIHYQICSDSVCFQDQEVHWNVETQIVSKSTSIETIAPELFKGYAALAATASRSTTQATTQKSAPNGTAPPVSISENKSQWGVPIALSAAFIAGILFNIVPCVLPMLPIKVLGFAEIAQHNRGKTLLLASTFGLGIVSVFAVLAMLILVFKKITWGEQFSNPIFAWGMVGLMLVLSLWLFGVLNINLPSSAYAFTPRHDTFFGNYLWGILTAIFSTPCTGPLFPPVMFWAQQQPIYVGVPAMMMVGVGMAFPYVLLSAFPEAARKFPRVGPWAELFKQMLGFILLGFTVFFAAGRFTESAAQWWATVPVAAMAAFYLLARTVQLTKEARPVAISSLIAVGIVTASVLVSCQFSGLFDAAPANGATASTVDWVPYSDSTLEASRKAGKIVLVKFTASWCLNCKLIEGTVYHDDTALQSLRKHDVVTLKADLTARDAAGWPRLRELSATGGIPLTAIYAPGYDKPVQISGPYTTDTLIKTLDQLDSMKTAAVQ